MLQQIGIRNASKSTSIDTDRSFYRSHRHRRRRRLLHAIVTLVGWLEGVFSLITEDQLLGPLQHHPFFSTEIVLYSECSVSQMCGFTGLESLDCSTFPVPRFSEDDRDRQSQTDMLSTPVVFLLPKSNTAHPE